MSSTNDSRRQAPKLPKYPVMLLAASDMLRRLIMLAQVFPRLPERLQWLHVNSRKASMCGGVGVAVFELLLGVYQGL